MKIVGLLLLKTVCVGDQDIKPHTLGRLGDGLNQRGIILSGKRRAHDHNGGLHICFCTPVSRLIHISHFRGGTLHQFHSFFRKMHISPAA